MNVLHLAARYGRVCLVLGLLAGFGLPGVAATLKPWIGAFVAFLLFLTAFRIGAREAVGGAKDLGRTLGIVAGLQLAAPLLALVVLSAFGWLGHPFALAVVLMLAAPSVTGAPNFAIMTGHDPAPAMRLLVFGTLVFPLTALPVLWLLPNLGGPEALIAAGRLVGAILAAVALGFLARHLTMPELSTTQRQSLDGLAAISLAVIVVGLMSAIGPLARDDPGRLMLWLVSVTALNLGLQIIALLALYRSGFRETVAVSIIAGNRNIALFLIALSGSATEPLLIFIGCYQVPMYLTPILMKPLHDLLKHNA